MYGASHASLHLLSHIGTDPARYTQELPPSPPPLHLLSKYAHATCDLFPCNRTVPLRRGGRDVLAPSPVLILALVTEATSRTGQTSRPAQLPDSCTQCRYAMSDDHLRREPLPQADRRRRQDHLVHTRRGGAHLPLDPSLGTRSYQPPGEHLQDSPVSAPSRGATHCSHHGRGHLRTQWRGA